MWSRAGIRTSDRPAYFVVAIPDYAPPPLPKKCQASTLYRAVEVPI